MSNLCHSGLVNLLHPNDAACINVSFIAFLLADLIKKIKCLKDQCESRSFIPILISDVTFSDTALQPQDWTGLPPCSPFASIVHVEEKKRDDLVCESINRSPPKNHYFSVLRSAESKSCRREQRRGKKMSVPEERELLN